MSRVSGADTMVRLEFRCRCGIRTALDVPLSSLATWAKKWGIPAAWVTVNGRAVCPACQKWGST